MRRAGGERPTRIKITLCRLLQESLANVFRHAQGKNCHVTVRGDEENLTLEVRDEGPGFQPNSGRRHGRLGLAGMRERVEVLGGTFELRIRGQPGHDGSRHPAARHPGRKPMSDRISIVVVDDHPLFRQGVVSALQGEPDFQVVGETDSGEQALQLARTLMPQVMLLDVSMAGWNGIVRRRRRSASPARPPPS